MQRTLLVAIIVSASVTSVGAPAGECAKDSYPHLDMLGAQSCASLGPKVLADMYRKIDGRTTLAETESGCREALARLPIYGITVNDVEHFPTAPASITYHCSDGKPRALVRLNEGSWGPLNLHPTWIQFPERFARRPTWGPPSNPEPHDPQWLPEDLLIITEETTQGEIYALPLGSLVFKTGRVMTIVQGQ
jgi:hypothetical protein